ncbi:unnamed protein product [Cuscuta epithymum]|uniref:Uncharacterized protein n=1 Tax=Cuscuta epithymum TaxID=186058 RepID=A0AAV0CCI6_9ASTE|nr:unnamed protein product [Cuscuta epithymum]
MREVIIVMFVEWLLVLLFAYYTDQITSSGKTPPLFLQSFQKKHSPLYQRSNLQRQGSNDSIEVEKHDVVPEIVNKFGNILDNLKMAVDRVRSWCMFKINC